MLDLDPVSDERMVDSFDALACSVYVSHSFDLNMKLMNE